MGVSPCAAAIVEREQQEHKRRKQEKKERKERERIEREKKDIERREQDLKRREPYLCPGQLYQERAAIKEAKKANLARENEKKKNSHKTVPVSLTTPVVATQLKTINEQELRGGVLYPRCDCSKKNGLQDDCERTLCQGRPECLTDPPMCIPGGGLGYISPCYPVCEPPCYE
jgi:hypothetical protein